METQQEPATTYESLVADTINPYESRKKCDELVAFEWKNLDATPRKVNDAALKMPLQPQLELPKKAKTDGDK